VDSVNKLELSRVETMRNRNINIIRKEGHSGFSSGAAEPTISTTAASPSPAPDDEVTDTYRVINQMVADGVIKNYALGGAMGAFFYIEPSYTADMDMFCALAHEPLSSGLVMLNPITDYLRSKGFDTTDIGAMIHGIDVQFQFPSDSLGEASIDSAITHDLDGTPVRVMTPEYLVAHMLKTNRPKDRLRLIRFIEAQAFDPATLFDILSEHGLEDKFEILEQLENEVST
jgi:hypothetical protein